MSLLKPRRRAAALVAAVSLGALLAAGTVTPASAATAPSAYSTAFKAKQGTVAVNTTVTGVVGVLLGPIVNPVLQSIIDPLTTGLVSLPSQLATPLLNAVLGGKTANTPPEGAASVTAPFNLAGGTSPTCAAAPGTCYQSVALDIAAPPVIDLRVSAANGITEKVTGVGYVAQSRLAGVHLDALGLDLLNLSAAHSTARSSIVGGVVTSGTSTASNISILGDLVRAEVADVGGLPVLTASVAGAPLVVGAVPVKVGNGLASVRLDGSLLHVAVNLSVTDLLTTLGLGALAPLIENLAALKATVNLVVGGASTTTTGTTESWGLAVGLGLGLDVSLNVLGLVGLNVKVSNPAPSATSLGNLLDLRLAYSNASSTGGAVIPDTWIAPGLT
jgi:hypothetical protein